MIFPVSHPSIGQHERELVNEVLSSGWLTQGKQVHAFEQKLADYLDVEHVIACTSGTTALHLALASLGIGPGDEVLVPDLTFVATANAVRYCGATPILVDIDPETWTIDMNDIVRHLSPRTRAIIPVHLYGVSCNMAAVLAFARAAGIDVIEDTAEGFGAERNGKALGTIGDAGTFSFYGNKIITTGEGGAVVTNSGHLAERLRFLRGQAMTKQRYFHSEVGFNFRMTELQAAIGRGQMERIDYMLGARKVVCDRYRERLSSFGYSPMTEDSAPWLFTMQIACGSRDELAERLAEDGIETRPTFVPLHRMPMYARPDEEFPIASLIGDTGLSFPTYDTLTEGAVDDICDAVIKNIGAVCAA